MLYEVITDESTAKNCNKVVSLDTWIPLMGLGPLIVLLSYNFV